MVAKELLSIIIRYCTLPGRWKQGSSAMRATVKALNGHVLLVGVEPRYTGVIGAIE